MTTKQKLLPPKGPLGSFFQFQREKTQEMIQAHPGKNMAHITKLLGLAYNKLPIAEKKKYEDLAAADMERYNREAQEFEEKCRRRIHAPKRRKSLPTNDGDDDADDDEEIYKENIAAKKIKVDKVYDIRKNSNDRVNKMQVEHAAGPRLGPNPNNPYVRRNPLNQVCFVQTDKVTGKETLIPYVYLLNKMISSMPKSQITPELLYQIETLRREDREDIKNGKASGFEKKHPEYTNTCKNQAPKKTKSLPTDDEEESEEEYEEDPPKKMKGKKVKDIKKDINEKENMMEVEAATESIPGPDPNNPYARRNSKNQICHVEIDELTGKETLIPYVYLLNEMISSMPESEVTPELQCQIEALMQEDKEDIERGKKGEKKMSEDLAEVDKERNKKELEESTEECKILTKQRTNSLPTDNDEEEYKENLPKKIKSVNLKVNVKAKVKDIKKHTNDKENNMKVEAGTGSRLGSNPNNPSVCRNPLNQVCFVQTDEVTGREILIPYVYYLNSMVNSMPKNEITPELQRQIDALRQEDKKDLKKGQSSGEKKKHYKYTRKRRIEAAKKRKNRLPTNNDKEYKRNPAKKVKGTKAKKTKKDISKEENKMEVEAAAEPIPDSNHHSSYLRRNSLNRVCFVKRDESTGEETLVPAMDTLNEIVNSIPEAKLDPELRHKIELAMQEDREDIENGKTSGEKVN